MMHFKLFVLSQRSIRGSIHLANHLFIQPSIHQAIRHPSNQPYIQQDISHPTVRSKIHRSSHPYSNSYVKSASQPSFLQPATQQAIYLSSTYRLRQQSVHSAVHSSRHPYIKPPNLKASHPPSHTSISTVNCASSYSSHQPSIYQSIQAAIDPAIHSSFQPSIHSNSHLFV